MGGGAGLKVPRARDAFRMIQNRMIDCEQKMKAEKKVIHKEEAVVAVSKIDDVCDEIIEIEEPIVDLEFAKGYDKLQEQLLKDLFM